MVNDSYRVTAARRLRGIYERLWVNCRPAALTEDEAEWLLRVSRELEAPAPQSEGRELSQAELLLVDMAVYGLPPVALRDFVEQSLPALSDAIREAERARDAGDADPRVEQVKRLLKESSDLLSRGESGPAATTKVEAIKLYRQIYNCTLFKAREACEALMPNPLRAA